MKECFAQAVECMSNESPGDLDSGKRTAKIEDIMKTEPGTAKIEEFLGNPEAVLEAVAADRKVMKYIPNLRPGVLTKEFCFRAYRANL